MSDPLLAPPAEGSGGDPIPELLRLGEHLARAREGAGLSQEALAGTLKVEPRLLRCLEAGDHSRLPEGVFVVALARRIAGTLHADVDDAIACVRQSRLMQHHSSGTPTPPLSRSVGPRLSGRSVARPAKARPAATPPRPSQRWRWPLAALLAAAGAMAGWLLLSQPRGGSPPPSTEATRPPVAAPEPTAPATPPPPAAAADTLRLRASEPSWLQVRDSQGRTLFEGTLTGEKSFPLGTGLAVLAGRPYAVTAAIGPATAAPLGGVDDIRWKRFTPGGTALSSPAP